MSGEIRIHAPSVDVHGGVQRIRFRVEGLQSPELWFDVRTAQEGLVAQTCDPAVVTLLAAAMDAGKNLVVQGPMSARLHWSIHNTVIPVVQRQLPFLQPIRVVAEGGRERAEPGGAGVLMGFSCGVDAFSALRDHFLGPDIDEEDRITHLVFCHLGHSGYGRGAPHRAEERWSRAARAAERLGLPLLRVDSNGPDFYPREYDSRLNWMATLTLRFSAVPLLLQAGMRRFLCSSSHSWEDLRIGPTYDMTIGEPVLLPALGTERVDLVSVGAEYTRVEKTKAIGGIPLAQDFLDVCIMVGDDVNCSRCEKCLRTILTLELLGRLDGFSRRFDMGEYRKHRTDFIARVLAERTSPYHLEIRELLRGQNSPVPLSARLKAALLRVWRLVPHDLRRRLRGLPRP